MVKDRVSGLMYYDDFVDEATELIRSMTEPYIILVSDFSDFKYINKLYTYEGGNDILRNFGTFLLEIPDCILAARTHTDHFVQMYRYISEEELVERIHNGKLQFAQRMKEKYPDVVVNTNVGAYFITDPEESLMIAIDKANIARRTVKGNFSIPCKVFSDSLMEEKEESAKISKLFDEALENDAIPVYIQPKIDILTQKIQGAEALSRLHDKDGNLVSPGVFVPILERSGRVVDLDLYVARYVFRMIRRWIDEGIRPVPVSVNLSRLHFYKPKFVEELIAEFDQYNIPPQLIEFEVTESVFFEDKAVIIAKITKLRDYGFHISVDDFGAGYSSLNMVGILPVDFIKLDRGFIKDSLRSRRGQEIIRGLINILNQINLDIICEGIETKAEEQMIFEYGCRQAQGFLYDKPIPAEEFYTKYMKERRMTRTRAGDFVTIQRQ